MRGAIRAALHPMMRSRGLGMLDLMTSVPHPRDEPRVHSSGLNADRVLLLGEGPAVGWGMATNDLALPGALARSITATTGRGADVDVVSSALMSPATAREALADIHLWRYDAVVLTLGLNEVVQLASIETWQHDLSELLDELDAGLSRFARVFVLEVNSITNISRLDRILDGIATQHLRAFNRATAALVAEREKASFVAYDSDRSGESTRTRGAREYQELARLLASAATPSLEVGWAATSSTPHRDERASGTDEDARLEAVLALDILDTEPEDSLDRIVELARQVFGTSSAAITVIDRDRQWTKAASGPFAQNTSLESSICRTTITTASGLVVADASVDDRFGDLRASKNGPPVRFYAGFPVEAPNGERIGALCVFDTEARDPAEVDQALLRDLALMVQSEIWARAS